MLDSIVERLGFRTARVMVQYFLPNAPDAITKEALEAVDRAASRFFEQYGDKYGDPYNSFLAQKTNLKTIIRSTFHTSEPLSAEDLDGDGYDDAENAPLEVRRDFVSMLVDEMKRSRELNGIIAKQNQRRENRISFNQLESKIDELTEQVQKSTGRQPQSSPPILTPSLPKHNLEGRTKTISSLKEIILSEGQRLVALHGLPGVGKTALAISLLHEPGILEHFSGGILWAGLGQDPDILSLLDEWGIALGISPDKLSKLQSVEERARHIRMVIGDRPMLLVADDVWQLRSALNFKLGGERSCHIITTRFANIADEFAGSQSIKVRELDESEGLSLLRQFVPRLVEKHTEPVRNLVELVGGLPLALVLIGGHLRKTAQSRGSLGVDDVMEKLFQVNERLRVAKTQSPIQPHPSLTKKEHVSLNSVISLSVDDLDSATSQALFDLTVFPSKPNSFSEEAGEKVSGISSRYIDLLVDSNLVDKSGTGRYTIHKTIVDFGSDKVSEDAYKRMVRFYVKYTEDNYQNYSLLSKERVNITKALNIALSQGMDRQLVRGASAIHRFLNARGHYHTTESYLTEALPIASSQEDPLQMSEILLGLGKAKQKQGKYPESRELLQKALNYADEAGRHETTGDILAGLGTSEIVMGLYPEAEKHCSKHLDLARELGDRKQISAALQGLGAVEGNRGDHHEAKKWHLKGLEIAIEVENLERISALLQNAGVASTNLGQMDEAKKYFERGISISKTLGDKERLCFLLGNKAWMLNKEEKYAQSKLCLEEGIPLARSIHHKEVLAFLLGTMIPVRHNLNEPGKAEKSYEEGIEVARDIGDLRTISDILLKWGDVQLDKENISLARSLYSDSLSTAESAGENGAKDFVAGATFGLAQVAEAQGNTSRARMLGEESLSLFESIDDARAEEVRMWLKNIDRYK